MSTPPEGIDTGQNPVVTASWGRTLPPAVMTVGPEDSGLRPEQASDLVADGREDLDGRHTLRHQRGHPPQRRLLLSQPGERGTALGVRDRRRHQLGEPA